MNNSSSMQNAFASMIISTALFACNAWADEAPSKPLSFQAPMAERPFVTLIEKLKKAEIIALLGEPSKADDVKLKDSGRIVASIWHYHDINFDQDGKIYPTTELDIVDDKVMQIVFLNNDGSEPDAEAKTYDLPSAPGAE
jgi:hypothetical protein